MNGLMEIHLKQSNQVININYKSREQFESLGDEVLNYDKYLMGYHICGLPVIDIIRSGIQIFIKAIDNKILTLEMEHSSKIKDIKMKIQEKTKKNFSDQQNLFFQGEILNNDKTIEYYEICEKSVIDIVARLRGGMQIFVKTIDGIKVTIEVLQSEKIINIKRKIQRFFPDEQKLVYQGEILNDDNKTIDEYQICDQSVINIVPKSNQLLLFLEAIKSGSLERVQHLYDNKLNEMDKRSLKSQIYANPSMIFNKIINYTIQILEGLQFLHNNQIIHRDIKLTNILLDNNGNVKLTDLGSELLLCTTDGRTTDYYMAPEIINGEPYSNSADIWSLGVIVIEMATGKLLYPDIELSPKVVIRIGQTRRIPYKLPESSPNYKLKLVIDQILNPESSNRPSATQLIDNFKKLS